MDKKVVEPRIKTHPIMQIRVNDSWKKQVPIKTAVKGSKAERVPPIGPPTYFTPRAKKITPNPWVRPNPNAPIKTLVEKEFPQIPWTEEKKEFCMKIANNKKNAPIKET